MFDACFSETTTLGLRCHIVERRVLARQAGHGGGGWAQAASEARATPGAAPSKRKATICCRCVAGARTATIRGRKGGRPKGMNARMGEQMPQLAALEAVLSAMGEVAVAVSGGVDSLTLAAFAHRVLGKRCVDVSCGITRGAARGDGAHAGSWPSARAGRCTVIDAGEFDNADYMRNPVNRCFYCKTSLYGAIRPHTAAQMVSGTNLDDLGEYRPGLIAAQGARRAPSVRRGGHAQAATCARSPATGLGDVAELPASPCLSSRIETGIAIDPAMLALVHANEQLVAQCTAPKTVRCRVRAGGVVIELDDASLERVDGGEQDACVAGSRACSIAGGYARR